MPRTYDLAVIGSGPGGYAAALAASRKGLQVALIEKAQVGGVCLNVGCIPTKALIAVAQIMRRLSEASDMGIQVEEARLAYEKVLLRNERIIAQLRQGLKSLLRHHHVELIEGEATFEDLNSLRISRDKGAFVLSANRFVVATGANPSAEPFGFDGRHLLSYRDLLALSALPSSLVIIGGGAIGCEFASCFANLGVQVTIVEQEPQLLPMEDPEAVRALTQVMQARGATILTHATIGRLTTSSEGIHVVISDGRSLDAAKCLIAIGQQPNSRGLGLEQFGIRTDGGIEVNEFLLTKQPHICAIGDCLPGHGLAHLASHEGLLAVRSLCDEKPAALNQRLVPRCVFTDPELAQVGLLESEAQGSVRVSRFSFAALGKSLCDEEREGFVKLLVDASTDQILGATIVGSQASNLIHLAVLAMQHGLSAKQLAQSITAHPTLPEAFTEAAAQIYGEALYSAGGSRLKAQGRVLPRASSLEP